MALPNDVVISVRSPDQLFNAPPIDPYSDREVELLGESGLEYLVRQLQACQRDWPQARLVVQLPLDQITADCAPQLAGGVRRYCRTKIANNVLKVRLIRARSSRGLLIVSAIVTSIVVVAYFLLTTAFAGAPQAVQVVVVFASSLFAWVTLWDVLEALLFNPLPLLHENATLRTLSGLDLVVEPEGSSVEAGDARASSTGAPTTSSA